MIYLLYGLGINSYRQNIIQGPLTPKNPENFYDYKGIINVHSSMSTGTGELAEIIRAAQKAKMNFIFITDLNLPLKSREFSGYNDNLFVFIDGEYSYQDSRILYLNESGGANPFTGNSTQMVLAHMLSQKNRPANRGQLILSHPFKRGFHWRGEYPPGLDGIEIINLKVLWQNAWLNNLPSFLWTLFIYPFNTELAFFRLFTYPEKEIALWDRLSQKRKTLAIAGTDAESKFRFLKNPLKFPSYETLFGFVSNHILLKSELTGQTDKDRKKISHAISQGHFYMSLDIMADPKGFNAFMNTDKKKFIPMGSDIVLENNPQLHVVLPRKPESPFEVVLYKNGQRLYASSDTRFHIPIDKPGVYRVLVRVFPTLPLPDGRKGIPWILTNPFYVKSQHSQ